MRLVAGGWLSIGAVHRDCPQGQRAGQPCVQLSAAISRRAAVGRSCRRAQGLRPPDQIPRRARAGNPLHSRGPHVLARPCRQQSQGLLPPGTAFDLFRGTAQSARDEVETYPTQVLGMWAR
jgi:hypothetical protein